MQRFLVFDLGEEADDRYTIIDTKVIVYDHPTFWVSVASFGDDPFCKDLGQCGSALMIPYKKLKEMRESKFPTLGNRIDFEQLPIKARKYANQFIKECDDPKTKFEEYKETGE